eukprot:GHRR01005291.1.p1 GENE.GHRR01005291.1~~GHRR01005291.1.p1  ORF type:complete len:648 (+),score=222.28 GHRR01005291.1:283-2226(+)
MFKGSMANYYHEARAQVKKIKTLQEENKKRAERRAEIIGPVAPDPLQQLTITGTSCKLLKSTESHATNEAGDNLVPWNGQQDNMIDRFDVRALLDFYKEPEPRILAARHKSIEELKLDEILRFERYRDLVRLVARGFTETQGLALTEQESLDRRAAQHAALQAATDQVYFNPKPGSSTGGPGTSGPGGLPAGTGMYSSVGFSYDNAAAGGAADAAPAGGAGVTTADVSSDDSSSDEDLSDFEIDMDAVGPESEADLAQEAEDERIDVIAEDFGLQDFSYRLHRAQEKEGEEEARMRKRPKKRMSRKKAANRAKRMAGMGLNPATGVPFNQHDPYKDPRALINPWQDPRDDPGSPGRPGAGRGSPSYDAGGWQTRDRSPSPLRLHGEKQYITEFVSAAGPSGAAGDGYPASGHQSRAGIIEAMPDRPDPAMLGGIQPVAREVMTLQGIRHDDVHKRLRQAADDDSPTYHARSRSRERSWDRGRRHSVTPPRRKAMSLSRSRTRSRSRSRSRHSRYKSRSRSRNRDRQRHDSCRRSSRSRSRNRHRDRRRSDDGAHYSSKAGSAYSGRRMPAGGASRAAAGGSSRASAVVGGGSSTAKVSSDCGGVMGIPMQVAMMGHQERCQCCFVHCGTVLPLCQWGWVGFHKRGRA